MIKQIKPIFYTANYHHLLVKVSILGILVLMFSLANTAYAIELVKWQRLPLAIPLHVGHERVIFVNRNVRVGVPSSIRDKLRVQSTGGSIYLLAHEPIPPTRIQLQDAETGMLILLDIAATTADKQEAILEPVQIIEGDNTPVKYGAANSSDTAATKSKINTASGKITETPIPVILTRYAAQNLYAPLRTIEPVAGISRVNIRRELDLGLLFPLLPVKAHLLAAWRLEDYWVSAVYLKNTSSEIIMLDPRRLQGNFIAATFQHPYLGIAGEASDTTIVYLITRQHGLAEALLPNINQINAQTNSGGHHEK